MGFTAEEVERIISKVMEGLTNGLPLASAMVLGVPQLNLEAPLRPEPVLKRTILEQRVENFSRPEKVLYFAGT